MSTHNICFYGELTKIILQLAPIPSISVLLVKLSSCRWPGGFSRDLSFLSHLTIGLVLSVIILKGCKTQIKEKSATIIFLSFRTDRSGQTQSSLIRVYTVCNFLCIFWMHYSKETPSCSTFRVITTNFLGVRIFRKFTVLTVYNRGDCRSPQQKNNKPCL